MEVLDERVLRSRDQSEPGAAMEETRRTDGD
jgi:hypothetical protein